MFKTGVRGADGIAAGGSTMVVNLTILYVRWGLYTLLAFGQGEITDQNEKSKLTM